MGKSVGYSRGQSSLGYLFGGGAEPTPQKPSDVITTTEPSQNPVEPYNTTETDDTKPASENPASDSSYNVINQNPLAAAHDSMTNNYHRVDGQNCGNYITNRLSTKVHAPPGGKSSLGYMFGDDRK